MRKSNTYYTETLFFGKLSDDKILCFESLSFHYVHTREIFFILIPNFFGVYWFKQSIKLQYIELRLLSGGFWLKYIWDILCVSLFFKCSLWELFRSDSHGISFECGRFKSIHEKIWILLEDEGTFSWLQVLWKIWKHEGMWRISGLVRITYTSSWKLNFTPLLPKNVRST